MWTYLLFTSRIDHLIDRLGKGGYDKYNAKAIKEKEDNVGIMLPCEVENFTFPSHASII